MKYFVALLLATIASADELADNQPDQSSPVQAAAPAPSDASGASAPIKFGNVVFTGTLRARFYVWNWFQGPLGENQYQYSGNVLRLNFAEIGDRFNWDAEFEIPFLLGLPRTATDPAPQGALGLGSNYYSANNNRQNVALIFPKQLYARFHGFGGNDGQSLQLGRFTFADGSELVPKNTTLATVKQTRVAQRLLGEFGFSDVGRSFDGVHYSYSQASDDFTFVAAVPTRGVFQVDGWGWNRAAFAYAAYTHDWGHGRHSADTRFFVLGYDDFRHILKTDNRPLAVRRADTENIVIETFGAHSVHVIETASGTLDAVAWGAVQTGRWGTEKQRAFAVDFEGGFQPKILPALRPWLRGGFTEGSGDKNPNDNTHGTFFQVLPTPRPYARFPFFNMMNLQDGYVDLTLRPAPRVTISSEFHTLRLSNPNDLWYSGGGVFQPWTFGYTGRSTSGRRSLANLYDTQVDYRASRKITLTAYLGYAQGLAAIAKIYAAGTDAQFGYLEFLYRF